MRPCFWIWITEKVQVIHSLYTEIVETRRKEPCNGLSQRKMPDECGGGKDGEI